MILLPFLSLLISLPAMLRVRVRLSASAAAASITPWARGVKPWAGRGSLLGPGALTSTETLRLVLLRSRPDTVHGVSLHKTRASTPLTAGSPPVSALCSSSPLL